jgi:hypothetical protein
MVSSDNPLSTTTRYYSNNYDSKRQTPSVANLQKNWGEERSHYLRTGVESANNPFSQNVQHHYQGFHGKKVEEKEEAP